MAAANGITGIGLFQDYRLKAPELQEFINYCKETTEASLSEVVFGVPNVADIIRAYREVLVRLSCLEEEVPSDEDLLAMRGAIEQFYNALNDAYLAVKRRVPVKE